MLANTYSFYSRFLSDFMFEMCFVQSVINIKQMTLQFFFKCGHQIANPSFGATLHPLKHYGR